jgi:hypothetical protein
MYEESPEDINELMEPENLLPAVVEDLAIQYIEKHGIRPSKELIDQWLNRVQGAYFNCQITKAK